MRIVSTKPTGSPIQLRARRRFRQQPGPEPLVGSYSWRSWIQEWKMLFAALCCSQERKKACKPSDHHQKHESSQKSKAWSRNLLEFCRNALPCQIPFCYPLPSLGNVHQARLRAIIVDVHCKVCQDLQCCNRLGHSVKGSAQSLRAGYTSTFTSNRWPLLHYIPTGEHMYDGYPIVWICCSNFSKERFLSSCIPCWSKRGDKRKNMK